MQKLLKTSIYIKVLPRKRMPATRSLTQTRIKDNGLSYRFSWISSFWLPILFLLFSSFLCLCSELCNQWWSVTLLPKQCYLYCASQIGVQSNYYSFCACLEIGSNSGLFSLQLSPECLHYHRHDEVCQILISCIVWPQKNVGVRERGREGLWRKSTLGSFIPSIVSNWLYICFVLGRF